MQQAGDDLFAGSGLALQQDGEGCWLVCQDLLA